MDFSHTREEIAVIFCANPKAQYMPYKDEINAAVLKVLDSGSYILGEQVSLFEEEFADYLGAGFAVGCGSGTDALVLALKALDIGAGDEVIVPSFTATPTVAAVVMAGATPVYVDIEPDYYTIDPACVENACTEKTKAIIPVHLYGQAADMDALMAIAKQHDLRVIEDCAQATGASYHGKRLGTIGDVGCFSFFPTKNLGAIGDGGAISCNDSQTADRLRGLRQYGWDENRISQEPGINSRLDELQAAILRVKLLYLDADNAFRKGIAESYFDELVSLPLTHPVLRAHSEHVFHQYVLQTKRREELISFLQSKGVAPSVHYPVPVHRMHGFYKDMTLPVTDKVIDNIISLPIYPGLSTEEQKQIIGSIRDFFAEGAINE